MYHVNERPILEINPFLQIQNSDYQSNLGQLFEKIKNEKNPRSFLNLYLAIAQLYFYGLISNNDDRQSWDNQEDTLNSINSLGIIMVGELYEKGVFDSNFVLKNLLQIKDCIMEHGDNYNTAKYRWMASHMKGIQKYGVVLEDYFRTIEDKPNVIVSIASGGFEPSYLAANIFGLEEILLVRPGKDELQLVLPTAIPDGYVDESVSTKNTLIIDDYINKGFSLKSVIEYMLISRAKKITAATVTGGNIEDIDTSLKANLVRTHPFIFQYD